MQYATCYIVNYFHSPFPWNLPKINGQKYIVSKTSSNTAYSCRTASIVVVYKNACEHKEWGLLRLTSSVACRSENSMASSVQLTAELFFCGCSHTSNSFWTLCAYAHEFLRNEYRPHNQHRLSVDELSMALKKSYRQKCNPRKCAEQRFTYIC